MQFLKCVVTVLLAGPIFGSSGGPQVAQNLTVHEWGTFTTVSGEDGSSVAWDPLGGASDLPCFVQHLHGKQYKSVAGGPETPVTKPVTVRMETPVLYFYSPTAAKVSVGVDFPHGLITEWYPRAAHISPEADRTMPPVQNGHIEWGPLEITPGEQPRWIRGVGASPYYAARETDSIPVRVGTEQEKFLFYRGIADFPVPVNARVAADGSVELRNTDAKPLALAVLFENRGGKVGYRTMHDVHGASEIAEPALTGNLAQLKADLGGALVAQGLYAKEAAAMVATWSDSWFEEGMRVFYLVPRGMVDRELPLTMAPAPKRIERVFVGRVELLSPYRRDLLMTALAGGDTKMLDKFDRFLAPFMHQVKVHSPASVWDYMTAKNARAIQEFLNPSCVQ